MRTNGEICRTNGRILRIKISESFPFVVPRDQKKMRRFTIGWVIALFALLHAGAAILCRSLHTDDTIVLTLLTMTLTVIICVRERLNMEFTAVNVILVNIVGYMLGIGFAMIISAIAGWSMAAHAVSTFITTEALGWGMLWFCTLIDTDERKETASISDSQLKWLIGAVGAVLMVRILIGSIIGVGLFNDVSMLDVAVDFGSNFAILLMLVCISIIFIQYQKRIRPRLKGSEMALLVTGFILLSSVISALLAGYGLPFSMRVDFTFKRFLENVTVSFIYETTIYSIAYVLDYAVTSRQAMEMERANANLAKSRYINLKQQVSPHFLFNSLNVLDCLVAEGKTAQAREFIHKLAGLYRYMLKTESEPVVSLREEIQYAEMYADLLMTRFPEGLKVEMHIREEDLSRYIVTASVQMLIENAIKHNAATASRPLRIVVSTDGQCLSVENNLIPRLDEVASTNLGLKYIRKNYLDRCGKEISIENTGESYRVVLPLL